MHAKEIASQVEAAAEPLPTKTIVCIASGPSLTPEDVNYVRGRADEVIVVNDNYLLAPWATALWACDAVWWNHHIRKNRVHETFEGELWTCSTEAWDNYRGYRLQYLASAPNPGLSRDPSIVHEGENGGYQAMNFAFHRLAQHCGRKRIVLIGYDMHGTLHWFGRHPDGMNDVEDFNERVPHFVQLAADLEAEGVEVINCSRVTALDVFRRAELKETLL